VLAEPGIAGLWEALLEGRLAELVVLAVEGVLAGAERRDARFGQADLAAGAADVAAADARRARRDARADDALLARRAAGRGRTAEDARRAARRRRVGVEGGPRPAVGGRRVDPAVLFERAPRV